MKTSKFLLALLILSIAGLGSAFAHGPRARVGVYIGAPVLGPVWGPAWGPGWYPPPYYYPPQPVVVLPPSPPPVYVEQAQPAPVEAQQQYWYYCPAAKAYYPYVKECPQGWQRVLPQPEN